MDCSHILGVLLLVAPVVCLQLQPKTFPLGLHWPLGQYRVFCIASGALGGSLLSRRQENRPGYRWAAGCLGGAVAASVAFYSSEALIKQVNDEPTFDLLIFALSAVPGLIVYALVKGCSDYTFPETHYHSLPDHPTFIDGTSTTNSSRPGTVPVIGMR